ncbi:hypothetical protein C8J57DRAFT_1713741 [Mycena rebaudengoi]|nr:hypothetical protein C8J57DRAFT_1713741 [Mycena rebaudengoi]
MKRYVMEKDPFDLFFLVPHLALKSALFSAGNNHCIYSATTRTLHAARAAHPLPSPSRSSFPRAPPLTALSPPPTALSPPIPRSSTPTPLSAEGGGIVRSARRLRGVPAAHPVLEHPLPRSCILDLAAWRGTSGSLSGAYIICTGARTPYPASQREIVLSAVRE